MHIPFQTQDARLLQAAYKRPHPVDHHGSASAQVSMVLKAAASLALTMPSVPRAEAMSG
jgi:hypothetical protein